MADKVRADKATAVAELSEHFRTSAATVLTEYRGLTVRQITDLRRSLGRETTYSVAKNTLAKRAAADAGIAGLDELFTGPTALAFVSGDPVEAAKSLREFAKANLSKAAALFQAPLAQAVRTVAALQDKREKDSGSAPADE